MTLTSSQFFDKNAKRAAVVHFSEELFRGITMSIFCEQVLSFLALNSEYIGSHD